jgi:hypothetical protein
VCNRPAVSPSARVSSTSTAHVHVLLVGQHRRARLLCAPDRQQLGADPRSRLAGHDPAAREHGEVREAPHQVLAQQLAVERQGAGESEYLGQQAALAGGVRLG